MEKPKFEFQKLELPKRVNYPIEPQSTDEKVDNGLFMDTDDAPKISTAKNKQATYVFFMLFTLIGLGLIYYIHEWNDTLRSILKNTEKQTKVRELSKNQQKEAINPSINVKNTTKNQFISIIMTQLSF